MYVGQAPLRRCLISSSAQTTMTTITPSTGCKSEELAGARKAAILYALGNTRSAIEEVESALLEVQGETTMSAWAVLFEIHRAAKRLDAFEDLSRRFLDTFPAGRAPRWKSPALQAAGALALEGDLLDARVVATIAKHAQDRKVVAIDMGRSGRIALEVAIALCDLIRTLRLRGRRVLLVSMGEAGALLLEEFHTGEPLDFIRRRTLQHCSVLHERLAA